MKYQIRQGIFETNSSTTHTITICHDTPKYNEYVGTTIVLGKDIPEDLFWNDNKKKNPVNKLHMLWISLIGYDSSISNFIHYIDFIKKTLGKIGINIEVVTDEETYKRWEYYGEDISVLSYAFKDEQALIDFIFNRDSWYDSWEDDSCYECPYENDIKEGNETYNYR